MNRQIKPKIGPGSLALTILVTILALVVAPTRSVASVTIPYQGRLTDPGGTPVSDGNYNLTFALYSDSTAGTAVWTESAAVTTTHGTFSHQLGSLSPLPTGLAVSYRNLFLQIKIGAETVQPRTRLGATFQSMTAAGLVVRNVDDSVTIKTSPDGTSLLFINPSTMDTTMLLRPDLGGDSSVVLPDNAISSQEMLNEPGATWSTESSLIALGTGTMSDLVSISVEIPEEGYILLFGKCYVMLSGTTGPNGAQIQIDEDAGGPAHYPYYQHVGMSGFVNSGLNYFPVMTMRIFYRQAGQYEFRLEGLATHAAPALAESWDHILIAQYFPTDIYGSAKSAPFLIPVLEENESTALSPEERYRRAKTSSRKN